MSFDGIEGQWVLLECNRKGFAISTGSACHSGMLAPASSMTALGYTGKKAKEYFRISLGRDTTEIDVINLADILVSINSEYIDKNHTLNHNLFYIQPFHCNIMKRLFFSFLS